LTSFHEGGKNEAFACLPQCIRKALLMLRMLSSEKPAERREKQYRRQLLLDSFQDAQQL
jgi:hypothetical protein